jgi:nitrate reductase gamma subunit
VTSQEILLWVALPYFAIATFSTGLWWRYRYDKFGWTTRSSQVYEVNVLRVASPLFHLGMLAVVGGHVIGLLIPETWTHALGISEGTYHLVAVSLGALSGLGTLLGISLLVYRRRMTQSVFVSTTKNDKLMYVFLLSTIVLGLATTLVGSGIVGDAYNYRETVSPWFRSILLFNPKPELMAASLPSFQIHAVAGMLLFMLWPFTRLVHAFSAPIMYFFRPYIVYRSRGDHVSGSRKPRRGWNSFT